MGRGSLFGQRVDVLTSLTLSILLSDASQGVKNRQGGEKMAFLEAAMRDLKPQQIFADHCDESGTMPKSRVVTAARVLGQNPAEVQVDQLVTRWDSAGLTLDQFQQVLSELDDEKPSDEMVSDVLTRFRRKWSLLRAV